MWRCWVGELNSLRVWHLKSRKLLFCSSFTIPSFKWNLLALTSHIQTQLFLALQMLWLRKNVLFHLVISRATGFFLVAMKYMPMCGHSDTATHRPTPWKYWKKWRYIFQLVKEKVWASIYKTDQCACIWEAGYLPNVSVNYPSSHHKSRCYWRKKKKK